jgi:hypothetical protein
LIVLAWAVLIETAQGFIYASYQVQVDAIIDQGRIDS